MPTDDPILAAAKRIAKTDQPKSVEWDEVSGPEQEHYQDMAAAALGTERPKKVKRPKK